ncbi:EF-hand domain-containing protein [Phenylobacterium terrae]|uniref:EF-hand domain-containing protein n=1 Tax=Phenylobacterium terrae TaxID=2665495 RepID=A0ABW4MYB4_9CAUL
MRIVIVAAALAAFATAASAQGFDPAAIFKQFDANNDGGISKEEWTAAGRPAERFDAVDTDKDGKVSQAELTAAIQKMMQQGGQ